MRLSSIVRRVFRRPPLFPDRGENAFRKLAENSADVIFHFGLDLKARYISPSAEQLLGWTPREIKELGGEANSNTLLHPEDAPKVAEAISRHLRGEIDELKLEFRMIRKDGVAVWVETNCRTVRDSETGHPSDLILTMRDISLKKAVEAELSELARRDGLTGLANRRAFDEALKREWGRTLRDGSQISLLLVDVDHFKSFNDRNGHQVGDDCLRAVAAALDKAVARPADLVARYGGEEFVIILVDTDQEGAVHIARTVLAEVDALRISHPHSSESPWVTVSIGAATAMAMAGGSIRMPEGLLQAADTALYKAKAAGRHRVETALLLTSDSAPAALSA
jgi:diguanylate cyclase (GGDEF)-like protein/PAS domain S-box-containing protein